MNGDPSRRPVDAIRRGLVVSCQAHGDHPLRDPHAMAAMAECAERGGAAGIRADGPEDIAEIASSVSLPVVGIYKAPLTADRFFITPTFEHAKEIRDAGAAVVALEATFENRPDTEELGELVRRIRHELGVPVMADVSTSDEGTRARDLGADLVATTLSGHTRESADREKPDLGLVGALANAGMRAVCEGNVRTPAQVAAAFERGAWSVVVGTAITDPVAVTSWFAGAAPGRRGKRRGHGATGRGAES